MIRQIGINLRKSVVLSSIFMFCVSSATEMTGEADSLSLRLYLPNSSVCTGTAELPLEFELWNVGQSDLKVSATGLGTSAYLMALYDTAEGRNRLESRGSVGHVFDKQEPPIRTLKAGSSFRVPGSLTLQKDFFHAQGFYKVRMGYSGYVFAGDTSTSVAISSNWVIFELTSCDPKTR